MIAFSIEGNATFIFLCHFESFFPIEFFKFFLTIYDRFAVFLWKLSRTTLNNMGYRVNVITITTTAQAGSLQRYSTSPSEWVKDRWHFILESIDSGPQFCFKMLNFLRLNMTIFQFIKTLLCFRDGII